MKYDVDYSVYLVTDRDLMTSSSLEDAQKAGADYIGVGAMFVTDTKTDARSTSMEELKKIRNSIFIPIVVIGGINHTTAPFFRDIGINGFAVVSAIIGASDVELAAKEMKKIAGAIITP